MGPFIGVLRLRHIFLLFLTVCEANDNAKRLYDDLLRATSYNRLVRPVMNDTEKVIVKLGMRLTRLIAVDERNQVITTSAWLRQEWYDYNLQWNAMEYGGLDKLEVPVTDIWLPDIVLFNNADGSYEISLMTKATLHPDGLVVWEPPAVYKSLCQIIVRYFPFDIQECNMKFASWTYDYNEVDLVHVCSPAVGPSGRIPNGVDLRHFTKSVAWDIIEAWAEKDMKKCTGCKDPIPEFTFEVHIRRKTLFHTVNLIIPCVAISFLTALVFYLPSDSGEKVALCISILLSLTVFFLLLSEIIPPNSNDVPLIAKYLLFTMILVTLSIVVTVIVLNVHFRSPSTHTMSPWVRQVFLNILPKLLIMRRPQQDDESEPEQKVAVRTCNGLEMRDSTLLNRHNRIDSKGSGLDGQRSEVTRPMLESPDYQNGQVVKRKRLNKDIYEAIESVCFIAEHMKNEDQESSIIEDWKYVAMVLDRLFLWIFATACIIGTLGVILQSSTLYDEREPITAESLPTGLC